MTMQQFATIIWKIIKLWIKQIVLSSPLTLFLVVAADYYFYDTSNIILLLIVMFFSPCALFYVQYIRDVVMLLPPRYPYTKTKSDIILCIFTALIITPFVPLMRISAKYETIRNAQGTTILRDHLSQLMYTRKRMLEFSELFDKFYQETNDFDLAFDRLCHSNDNNNDDDVYTLELPISRTIDSAYDNGYFDDIFLNDNLTNYVLILNRPQHDRG